MKHDFQQILTDYTNQIYRTCKGFASGDDVNDLFQEVCINIWRGLKSYRGDAKISTWIYRITINTCLLFKRDQTKRASFERLDSSEQYTYQLHNDPYNDTIDRKIELLFDFINRLEVQERAVILLYLEGLQYSDISDITGFSINNIGVKINRIKKKLALKFKSNGQFTNTME